MRRVLYLFLILVASNLSVLAQTPAPMGCSSGEIFQDAQDWWIPVGSQAGNNFGHVHTGACVPAGRTISGVHTFRVRTIMHHNPGQLIRITAGTNKDTAKLSSAPSCKPDDVCVDKNSFPRTMVKCSETGGTFDVAADTCTWWDNITLDTRWYYDGVQAFRFRSRVAQSTGDDMYGKIEWACVLKNGNPVKNNGNIGLDELVAKGWYTDMKYAVAQLKPFPTSPVKSIWAPSVNMWGNLPVASHLVALDTDFHHGNTGTTVHAGSGGYKATLHIDTTKLANGWHKLFLKTDIPDAKRDSTNSGVLVVQFEVQN